MFSDVTDFNWNLLFTSPFGWLSIAVVAGIIGSVFTSYFNNWRRVRESEQMNALKQNMIDRGMSGEEIERVLNAGRTRKPDANA